MRALVLLASLAACAELPDLGVCGNGIVEASLGEACDGSEGCTASCEVACDAERACEDGQTCGVDNVCRAASGLFAPIGAPQLFDVSTMRAGDFNADEITDLVGTSATQIAVLYGSTSVDPLTSGFAQDVPSSTSAPVIYERDILNPDGSNLAIAVPTDGIALVISDTETFQPRIVGPFAVDADQRMMAAVVDPDPQLGEVVLEITDPQGQGAPIRVARPALGSAIGAVPLPDCTSVASRLIGRDVTRDRSSLVLAVANSNNNLWRICVYQHSTDAPPRFVLAPTTFNTAPPTSMALANIDADPCEEMVIARSPVSSSDTVVEFVDATGTDCTFASSTTPITGGTLVGTDTEILAAGPSGSANRDVLVFGNGVYAVTAAGLVRMTSPTLGGQWNVASIVDLNRDGFADIVAGLSNRQNVEIVRGGPTSELNSYEVSTDVRVLRMSPGDFDGDGYGDVAFVEHGAGDRLSVLYGRADGEVAPPTPNSRFQGSLGVATLRRFGWGNTSQGRDGIDDLFVVHHVDATMTSPAETTAGVMIGDSSRVLTMPRFPETQRATVGTLAIGRFANDLVSAVAIRPTSSTSSELLTFDLESTFTPPVPLNGLVVEPTRPGTVLRTSGAPLIVVVSKDGPRALDITGVTCAESPTVEILGVHPIDVDGDGLDELAVLDEVKNRVRVYRVTGGAACSIGEELLGDALATCRDVARLGDTTVAACIKSAPFGPGLYRIVDGVREPTPFAELDGTPVLMTPGDYDGDGVLDLAINVSQSGLGSVQFVRQCPAHDTRGCR
jgi:hypothetical protein